jgi:ABC-2 type transport system ATP-binding protein
MSSHLLNEVQEVCDKVAIIDQGTLLTYDSVENLSAGQEATIIVDVLTSATPREFAAIRALKGVTSVRRAENNKLIISVSGGAEEQAKLLRRILNSGVSVVSFTPQHAAIEDAYLHLVSEEEY